MINVPKKDFCFCTLALGKKYRDLAKNLTLDLDKYAPGVSFVIGTDRVQDFADYDNAIAFRLYQDRRPGAGAQGAGERHRPRTHPEGRSPERETLPETTCCHDP